MLDQELQSLKLTVSSIVWTVQFTEWRRPGTGVAVLYIPIMYEMPVGIARLDIVTLFFPLFTSLFTSLL